VGLSKQSVLTINGGSSSIKFALYLIEASLARKLTGKINRIGISGTQLIFSDPSRGQQGTIDVEATDHNSAVDYLIDWLEERIGFAQVTAVGHRVVHGMKHSDPELVSQALLDELHRISSAELAPKGEWRMGANPHANGGKLMRDLRMPDFRDYAVKVPSPGEVKAEATRAQGEFMRDVMKLNAEAHNFRIFSPDETASNRWGAVFEVTNRCSTADILPGDEHIAPDGWVMEMLSEHQCQGWLKGYLLTGRHGFFSCYEAFIHIVDSMFNQHAKWLDVARDIPWRRPIASLNYLLSSHVWRQDHNGFSHQDPGFIDLAVNKEAEIVRIYLPVKKLIRIEISTC